MDSRQETRSNADLRHLEREKRLKKILAAKAKPHATEIGESDALVIGLGPGMCTVLVEGEIRHVRCEIPVVPGDEVSVRYEKVSGIAPRRTTLSRTDPGNENRERLIAANIDLLVIVAAMVDPPFRPGLIDRYLIAAARGGVKPILCINKIDLCRDTCRRAEIFPIPIVRCSRQRLAKESKNCGTCLRGVWRRWRDTAEWARVPC